MIKEKFMKLAIERSKYGMDNNFGGPFGAVIVKNNEIIADGFNIVTSSNDPTAHAEVTVIRKACEKLKTFNLEDCELYTSCEPCPMCLSAIIWSNIKKVYFGCTKKDAGEIGFRDDMIYEYLKGNNKDLIQLEEMNREECIKTFEEYKKQNGVIYQFNGYSLKLNNFKERIFKKYSFF